jgi:formate/nitrite transporter FocA (FNT family)
MQRNSVDGKFQWAKIWIVPMAITLAGALVFALLFHVPNAADFQKKKPQQEQALAVAVNR